MISKPEIPQLPQSEVSAVVKVRAICLFLYDSASFASSNVEIIAECLIHSSSDVSEEKEKTREVGS